MKVQESLEAESAALLGDLIRFDAVNPPGNERASIEYLERYLAEAGFDCKVYADDPARPNLVAVLAGADDGLVLGLLGHVDTVLADPSDWTHDPWSGELIDGFVWGRGALDMKNQVAAEVVAAARLARRGWRPSRGALKVIVVSDEETGGHVGARWLCDTHPNAARCDFVLNEGAGEVFEFAGTRYHGLGCGEKGAFRFTIAARGEAGHASTPDAGDNAIFRLIPVLAALADQPATFDVVEATSGLLSGLGLDPADPRTALSQIRRADPVLHDMIAPLFSVTLAPTIMSASPKINVIPARAEIRVDCRVPPGLGEPEARRRIDAVLGSVLAQSSGAISIEFTECQTGTVSPADTMLGAFVARWLDAHDPGSVLVPFVCTGGTDSKFFREAFPGCAAYGFFPHRHMTYLQTTALFHNADERIDVRDLAFATRFYADCIAAFLN